MRQANLFEQSLQKILQGWDAYRIAVRAQSEGAAGIGDDYVLGPEWAAIGKGLLGLLNGETGRIDCGSFDGYVRKLFVAEGFSDEGNETGGGK